MQSQSSDRIQRTSHHAPLTQPAPPPLPSSVAPNPTPHPATKATSLLTSHLLPLPIHPHSHLSCPHRSALLHHRPSRSLASTSRCARHIPGCRRQRRCHQSPCLAVLAGSLASRALASQLRPALLVNQRYRHGPSVVTTTTTSKTVLKVLLPPLSPLLALAVNGVLLI
jgi:hypothetical protein